MVDEHEIPSVGRFEDAHGTSAAAGQTLVFQAVPDGVRPLDPASAQPQVHRTSTQFDSASARDAARRRWQRDKLPDFAKKEIQFIPTEALAPFDAGRRDLLERKEIEIVEMTRAASAGVMTTTRGYTWLFMFGEFYATRAATTGSDADADRARRFFKDASIELAKVHELARAEASARRQNASPADAERELREAMTVGARNV